MACSTRSGVTEPHQGMELEPLHHNGRGVRRGQQPGQPVRLGIVVHAIASVTRTSRIPIVQNSFQCLQWASWGFLLEPTG
jgi:hypothetical protein